ncbi:unnamed protein product [Musa banksii]
MGNDAWRLRHGHRSFSSSLLDAIERSMDDPIAPKNEEMANRLAHGASDFLVPLASMERRPTATVTRPRRPDFPPFSTSSSSCNSTSSGFFSSSSERESPAALPLRLRPSRSPPPDQHRQQDMERSGSTRTKLRGLKKYKAPGSPGALLAGFLNSLCTAAAGDRAKPKPSPSGADSACSAVSSRARPCLSKAPSTRDPAEGGNRSVRFRADGEDPRRCGQTKKSACGGDHAVVEARGVKMRVKELLRTLAEEGEEEQDDLFELETLMVMEGGGYRDELPVYGTTRPEKNRSRSN